MTHCFEKRRPPFITLSRHRRSDEVIRLKEKIQRDANEYGGRFTSRLVLDEPGRPDLYSQGFNFYFPGKNRFTLWNAEIVTARLAFWDAAHYLAYTRLDSMLTSEERLAEPKIEFEPAQLSSTGKVLSYKLTEHEKIRYEQFGGRTLFEQWERLESEIILTEPPIIHESFKIDRGYSYGIGLYIVLDFDVIDRAAIEFAMNKFFEIGESDWQSPNPVPRERLPEVSEKEALAAIKNPF